MRSKLAIAVGLVALLTTPAALAEWSGKGGWEPDTTKDLEGWNHLNRDTTPTDEPVKKRQVYLNGIMGQEIGYLPSFGTSINPNFATLETGQSTFPYRPRAMLGVWKDCNNDGYVGLGDNALFEYRSILLTNTNVCKVESPTPTGDNWFPPHNDGTWVHEFIPLGYDSRWPGSTKPDVNRWNLNDPGSRMWVDDGLPGDPPSGTCYTTAHPPGTYHSVGGLTNFTDCYLTGRVEQTGSSTACTAGSCSTWEDVKAIRNPWGEETDGSYAYVWDCDNQLASTPKVGNVQFFVHAPKVPTTSTSGSPAGTANWTGSGFTRDCEPNFHSDETNPGQAVAKGPYQTERDDVNNEVAYKIQPEFWMTFAERTRASGAPPDQVGLGDPVNSMGFWSSNQVRAVSRNPYVDRTFIAPQTVSIFTFYAYVSPSAVSAYGLTLPKGSATGVYGAEACTNGIGTGKGVQNRWACDPALWYPNGAASIPRDVNLGPGPDGQGEIIAPFVGSLYNLRDTDCYDMSVTTVRTVVHYGVLTGTDCSRP